MMLNFNRVAYVALFALIACLNLFPVTFPPGKPEIVRRDPLTPVAARLPSHDSRHRLILNLNSLEELRIREGIKVKKGEIISDRPGERERLKREKRQLTLNLQHLSAPIPKIAPLPPPDYRSEEIAIERARVQLARIRTRIANFPDFHFLHGEYREVFESGKVKELRDLEEKEILATLQLEEAKTGLEEAKKRYLTDKYRHSLEVAKYHDRLQKQKLDLAGIENKIAGVEERLGAIVTVRSPYNGRIRKIKVIGQKDRVLTVEVLLKVSRE